jgi:hypothetical protein
MSDNSVPVSKQQTILRKALNEKQRALDLLQNGFKKWIYPEYQPRD